MHQSSRKGMTLLELLIVIAIIGILAAVLLPNLLQARSTGIDRAAQVYGNTVYKAGFAYVAENINNAVVTGTCTAGYTAGDYLIPNPGTKIVTSCQVTDTDGDTIPEVVVVSARGKTFSIP